MTLSEGVTPARDPAALQAQWDAYLGDPASASEKAEAVLDVLMTPYTDWLRPLAAHAHLEVTPRELASLLALTIEDAILLPDPERRLNELCMAVMRELREPDVEAIWTADPSELRGVDLATAELVIQRLERMNEAAIALAALTVDEFLRIGAETAEEVATSMEADAGRQADSERGAVLLRRAREAREVARQLRERST